MPIPWFGYQPFEKSNKPWRERAKTFNRLTHFETASGQLVVGVDQLDGKTQSQDKKNPNESLNSHVLLPFAMRAAPTLDQINEWKLP